MAAAYGAHCMICSTLWERRVMEEEQGAMAYFTSWASAAELSLL